MLYRYQIAKVIRIIVLTLNMVGIHAFATWEGKRTIMNTDGLM